KAHENLPQFRGQNEAELAGWLRRILANNLAEAARRFGPGMRDLARERSLETALEESSARLEGGLASEQSSPSRQLERRRQALRLAHAMAQLSDDQRLAVELHHLKGLAVAEVGAQMGRSKQSVMGLLFRGLKKLRELLGEDGGMGDDR